MSSYIRILHASPDSPPVDVYANNDRMATGLSYRNFTEYRPVQAGNYNIQIYPAGSREQPVLETNLTIPPDSIQTLAITGKQSATALRAISDQPATPLDPNGLLLKFVHLSPDTPSVDVTLPDQRTLFSDVSYQESTNYTPLAPGTYTLQTQPAGTSNVILNVPNQSLSAGRAYSAYMIGLSSGDPSLQLLTPLDGVSYLNTDDNPSGNPSNSGQVILDSAEADVNGDGTPDRILLRGDKPDPDSPFSENITLCVEDGKTANTICTTPPSNSGYGAYLSLGDFTGDQVPDILLRMDSGGSGGYLFAYIYTVTDNRLVKIFDYDQFNASSQFQVTFQNNYQVRVAQINGNRTFTLDISNYKEEFSDLYDSSGRLITPTEGSVLGLGGLNPVDVDQDGILELVALQRIIGRYNAETIGYVRTTLKWSGTNFVPQQVEVISDVDE